jgi:site-specific DNA recombinase
MVHHDAVKKQRRYPYYVCRRATQRGWSTCPAPSLPAAEVEQFVVEQIFRLADEQGSLDRPLAYWESLSADGRLAWVSRLIERIVYHGQEERIAISFRRDGVQALVAQLTEFQQQPL